MKNLLTEGNILNGTYRIEQFVARGGMGNVYTGVNIETGDRVAIKVVAPHLASDRKTLTLFRAEARLLTRVAHPAVVAYRVFARDPALDIHYIVTDFVEGDVLSARINGQPAGLNEIIALLRRLATGLRAMHHAGAIHCDMAPDNVLLPGGRTECAMILDLGIAHSLNPGDATVVMDGFAGKLGYVAPEQFGVGRWPIGAWTDAYSTALVILAFAGGRPVDMGRTLADAIERRRVIPRLDDAPAMLRPLLYAMLQPDPAHRIGSMDMVLSTLDAADGAPSPAIRVSREPRPIFGRRFVLSLPRIITPARRLINPLVSRVRLADQTIARRHMGWPVIGSLVSGLAALGIVLLMPVSPFLQPPATTLALPGRGVSMPLAPASVGMVLPTDQPDVAAAMPTIGAPQGQHGYPAGGVARSTHPAPAAAHPLGKQPRSSRRRVVAQTSAVLGIGQGRPPTAATNHSAVLICWRYDGRRWRDLGALAGPDCMRRGFAKASAQYVQFGHDLLSRREGRIGVSKRGVWQPVTWVTGAMGGGDKSLPPYSWSSESTRTAAARFAAAVSICRFYDGAQWRRIGVLSIKDCAERGFAQPGVGHVQAGLYHLSRHATRIGILQGDNWRPIGKVIEQEARQPMISLLLH